MSARASEKKSKLKAVDPKAAAVSKPKILIFGRYGVGKTWAALDFPSVYYIDTEGGADLSHYTDKLKASGGMYFGPEQGSQDFATVIEQIEALATEKHQFKTVVIDSVSKIFNDEITQEYESLQKQGRDMSKTFGAEKKPAVNMVRRLIRWIDRIDMNVILIAHEKAEWVNDKQVGMTFDCHEKLGYELHLCLNIEKQGNSRKARVKKSRLKQFADASTFDWSYEDFARIYGKDVIEGEVKQVELASQEQLDELDHLLKTIKLPDGTVEKWLKAASVDTFAEMDKGKVAACIESMKKKVTEKPTKESEQ